MKNYLRILGIVMAASFFGAVSSVSAAEPASGWQNNMGPGMMGDCGHGIGMMGGYGSGYGMGPGMMDGYGHGYGMGHGMMGWGNFQGLDLSKDQKAKVRQIRHEMRKKQWAIMGQMMDAHDKLQDLYDADKQDSEAIKKQYKVIEDLRLQMIDNSIDAHNQINGILTKEQQEKFQEWGGRGYGPMMRGY